METIWSFAQMFLNRVCLSWENEKKKYKRQSSPACRVSCLVFQYSSEILLKQINKWSSTLYLICSISDKIPVRSDKKFHFISDWLLKENFVSFTIKLLLVVLATLVFCPSLSPSLCPSHLSHQSHRSYQSNQSHQYPLCHYIVSFPSLTNHCDFHSFLNKMISNQFNFFQ